MPTWTQLVTTKSGDRWRAARMIDGVRRWGSLRLTLDLAHGDALAMGGASVQLDNNRMTVGEAIAQVREELRTKRSPATLKWFDQQVVPLKRCWQPHVLLSSVSQHGIELFIRGRLFPHDAKKHRPVSPATVRHNLRALSRILRLAIRRGFLATNPLTNVDLPRMERRKMDFFTPVEVGVLLRKMRESRFREREAHADMVELLFLTGLRRAELARLRTSDIDLEKGTIFVRGKTGARELPIANKGLVKVLARMLLRVHDGDELVHGGQYAIQTTFRRWRDRLKEDRLHPHALRHSFATALVAAGNDVHTIATVMGHVGLAMVMRYLHARGEAVTTAMQSLRVPSTRGRSLPRSEERGSSGRRSKGPDPSAAPDTSASSA